MRLFDLTSEGTAVPLIPGEDAEIAKTRRGVGDSPEIGSGERHLPTGLSIDLAEVPDTEYDLAALLDQVVTTLTRFVAFTDHHQAVITALYVAATHSVAQGWTVPYLTIYRWRYVGSGPPAIRVGVHLRFEHRSLLEWVDARREGGHDEISRARGGR
jgi:hypothetical protein